MLYYLQESLITLDAVSVIIVGVKAKLFYFFRASWDTSYEINLNLAAWLGSILQKPQLIETLRSLFSLKLFCTLILHLRIISLDVHV